MNTLDHLKSHNYINLIDKSLEQKMSLTHLWNDYREAEKILGKCGISFENKSMPFLPLPFVVEESFDILMRKKFENLHKILEKTINILLEEEKIQDLLCLYPKYTKLFDIECQYRPRIHFCRFDYTINSDGHIQVFELNTACPAAMVFAETFDKITKNTKTTNQFLETNNLEFIDYPLSKPNLFANSIIDVYKERGDRSPLVAVLNSRYNTLNNELDLIAEQITSIGAKGIRCFVEDLNYNGKYLSYNGHKIDICINKFDNLTSPDFECAFTKKNIDAKAYLSALKDGNVLGINSFQSMFLTESKGLLALLGNPVFQKYLTKEENELISEIIPETELLKGIKKDRRSFFEENKNEYVLKKTFDTRGRSVIIGCEVDQKYWNEMLINACSDQHAEYIIQKFVSPICSQPTQVVSSISGLTNAFTSFAYFLFRGKAVGMITRTADECITNVGRNGTVQSNIVVNTNSTM
jgi:uncharacterized circularly permuted ATP-grasp superfamily protein